MSIRRYMIAYRPGDDPKGKLRVAMGGLADVRAAFSETYPRLTWSSDRSARPAEDRNFGLELGLERDLTDHLDKSMPGWKRISPTRLKAKPSGIVVELAGDPDCVRNVVMELGQTSLNPLGEMCKRRGWMLEDPDSTDDVDLDDVDGWLDAHYG